MSGHTRLNSDSRSDATIRRATEGDLPAMAEMAAALVRFHHGLDGARFFLPDEVERGYRGWFQRELGNAQALLLVAEQAGTVVGYAYGRIEDRDWNMLLERHAALHDLFVREDMRGHGLAEALVKGFATEARAERAPRIVLHTASKNVHAQALFSRLGFQQTMVEMTLELGSG